jgi:hypothetical protein
MSIWPQRGSKKNGARSNAILGEQNSQFGNNRQKDDASHCVSLPAKAAEAWESDFDREWSENSDCGAALQEISRSKPNLRNRIAEPVESAVVELAIQERRGGKCEPPMNLEKSNNHLAGRSALRLAAP